VEIIKQKKLRKNKANNSKLMNIVNIALGGLFILIMLGYALFNNFVD